MVSLLETLALLSWKSWYKEENYSFGIDGTFI